MNIDLLKQKIILGTVQLGVPYGINNSQGKPSREEAFKILDVALHHKIHLLDTADAYGDATSVLGSYFRHNKHAKFGIINKFINDGVSLEEKIENSLNLYNSEDFYGYMFHHFPDYSSGEFRSILKHLKEKGKIQRIGVSVYGTDELVKVIEDRDVDLIQLPLNPLDNSVEKRLLLQQAKKLGKEIHVRSIFLQGLLLRNPEQLTGNITQLYEALEHFQSILKKHQLTALQLCLNYALHQQNVDYVLIGIENNKQLETNIMSILPTLSDHLLADLDSIVIGNRALLNPSHWRPEN